MLVLPFPVVEVGDRHEKHGLQQSYSNTRGTTQEVSNGQNRCSKFLPMSTWGRGEHWVARCVASGYPWKKPWSQMKTVLDEKPWHVTDIHKDIQTERKATSK